MKKIFDFLARIAKDNLLPWIYAVWWQEEHPEPGGEGIDFLIKSWGSFLPPTP